MDTLRKVLLGTAYGDALGRDFEFIGMPTEEDWEKVLRETKRLITDDTQMMLFLVQALQSKNSRFIDALQLAYGDWFKTQTKQHDPHVVYAYGLLRFGSLWHVRAPGNTCITSSGFLVHGLPRPQNNSKGNGTVMRCAPIGVINALSDVSVVKTVAMASVDAGITHDHQYAKQGSIIWVLLHYFATKGESLGDAIKHTKDTVKFDTGPFFKYELLPDEEFKLVRSNAEAWVAEDAVAIALRSVLGAKDWLSAVKSAACIKGDSDTVGSMAGGLAAHYHSIPELGTLDAQDAIDSLC